jgi:cytochrome c biogenesis protein CcmG/thiol:disulfide interchange protein DsbE
MTGEPVPAPRRRWAALIPLAIFVVLAAIFLSQLLSGRDISTVPSALIGEPAPETKLPPIAGLDIPGIDSAEFVGKVTLVNVWASWCAPCREEHPMLMALAKDGRFSIAGLNYKDKPDNARKFLTELGNPFTVAGADQNGREAIDWGVYGVPETFLVGRDGKILFKHVGPLNAASVETELLPQIEKALAASPG